MGQCFSQNTQADCGVSALPTSGSTVYCSPGNNCPVEAIFESNGQCSVFSCATVDLYQGDTLITHCRQYDNMYGTTDLPLDQPGTRELVYCEPGAAADGYPFARGNLAPGVYSLIVPLSAGNTATNSFTIVHTQSVTTSTPTETATATATDTAVVTSPIFTTTTSPEQATVTTPAATVPQTVTVTPDSVTVTPTDTVTRTRYSDAWTWRHQTITSTQPCPTPKPCPTGRGKKSKGQGQGKRNVAETRPHGIAARAHNLDRARRQAPGCSTDGASVTGDGPATVTQFADPSVTTTTITDPTSTVTSTSYTTSTITIPPDPATTTVASGTLTNQVSVTLAPGTVTVTQHSTKKTTLGRTHTRTVTYTKKAAPTSCYKPKKPVPKGNGRGKGY